MADFNYSLGFEIPSENTVNPTHKYKGGFPAGYQLPAPHFNWILDRTSKSIDEIHEFLTATTIRAGSNLNEFTDIGMYVYSSADSASIGNVPEKGQSTMLVVPRLLPNDTNNRIQIVTSQTGTLYLRNLIGGTWEPWTQYRKQTDIVSTKYGGTGASDIPNARKNLGLPETCITITDWNEATKTGWYMANNAENAPTVSETGGTAWYFGFVISHATGYVFQEVYQFSASASAILVPKYIRAQTAGTWGQWYDVTVQRTVPQAAKMEHIKSLTSDAQVQLNNLYENKLNKNPAFIELTPADGTNNGGYIDFHFGGSDKDYTVRLIEEVEGILKLRGAFQAEGNLYENLTNRVYSTGHKPTPADIGAAEAVKHKLITYSSLADLGLSAGSETIANIVAKMVDNSMLVYQTDSANANIYPHSSLVVTVKRANVNRVEFFATRVNGSQLWFGNYHKDSGWTGWKEIYHEGALPTPAQIGASPSGHGHALTDSVITGVLPITKGGTGATEIGQARANLGFATGTYTSNNNQGLGMTLGPPNSNVILIWKKSPKDTTLGSEQHYKTILTPMGGFCFGNDSGIDAVWTTGMAYYQNGYLWAKSGLGDGSIQESHRRAINGDGTYYYQVL